MRKCCWGGGRLWGGPREDAGESEEGGALGIGCREQVGVARKRGEGGSLAHPRLCVWRSEVKKSSSV